MTDLPAPPVPADCDLQDFSFMPLDVMRLRTSDLAAMEPPEACWAGVMLWCASWHQVPASSVPDDDRVLASLAGYGRNVKGWLKVRTGALRGFVLCQEPPVPGVKTPPARLYHLVVAEKALEAWLEKLAQRISGSEGNAKRWGAAFDRAPLDAAMVETRRLLAVLNPQSRALSKKRTAGVPIASGGDPDPIPAGSQRDRKGQGQGQGQGQGGGESATPTPRSNLIRELRRRGLSTAQEAVDEWGAFLQGSCGLRSPDEVARAIDLILEAARRDGIAIWYSKHAARFGDEVARKLKHERKATT